MLRCNKEYAFSVNAASGYHRSVSFDDGGVQQVHSQQAAAACFRGVSFHPGLRHELPR